MSGWKKKYIDAVNNTFKQKNVLVIGDLMVDEYIIGKVKRISPEAPVPVLDFSERSLKAGGASNVAHNIRSLGAKVSIAGIAADDQPGKWLRSHFEEIGIESKGIVSEASRPTTLKTRYATKGQQLLRMDNEVADDILEETQVQILNYLSANINDYDAVVLSDYKKGVLNSKEFVRKIISICNENKVFVSIDSKSRNIEAFENADFVKPNNLELEEAVGVQIRDEDSLNLAGSKYLSRSGARALVVTRGSKGISVFEPQKSRQDFPAKDVQVYDVCGAGDTVISTISLARISGLSMDESVKLANLAAGVVITKVGTVAVTSEELIGSINAE
ncbi:bifunctional heptose 7-phosphate kinase/heptose 1-phosphate adenyltransferase [Butyrivibrio fibrisolvens]|uniref:bifunctional heptose 7-phosphate kinase/heptose 1-phosphate adenyltransferase n=1 Tax=Butyrivibrio fibrisolvens TaxID=831 RepID=UPI000685BB06|nr:bifunctional ADP-heptose synthase [Butyrivibrio fibrisolvens]